MAELYQIVGAMLRDITQARVMSDLYSRSISRHYEQDSLLRRFPVPRAEISELEIDLAFALSRVAIDPNRRDALNARISSILEDYSATLIRGIIDRLKDRADRLKGRKDLTTAQTNALNAFDAKFLSTEFRDLLRGRLLRYFEDNQTKLIDASGNLNVDAAVEAIKQFTLQLAQETPEVSQLLTILKEEVQKAWDDILTNVSERLQSMQGEIHEAFKSTEEFKVEVEVDATTLAGRAPDTVSTVKMKCSVRNYTWAKVDTDPKDLRSIRRLVPES
jgi:hypothetical protein